MGSLNANRRSFLAVGLSLPILAGCPGERLRGLAANAATPSVATEGGLPAVLLKRCSSSRRVRWRCASHRQPASC